MEYLLRKILGISASQCWKYFGVGGSSAGIKRVPVNGLKDGERQATSCCNLPVKAEGNQSKLHQNFSGLCRTQWWIRTFGRKHKKCISDGMDGIFCVFGILLHFCCRPCLLQQKKIGSKITWEHRNTERWRKDSSLSSGSAIVVSWLSDAVAVGAPSAAAAQQ